MNLLHTSGNRIRLIVLLFFSYFGMLPTTASNSFLKLNPNFENKNTAITLITTLQNTEIVITKDTTDETLKDLALKINEKGTAFSYSNVERNTLGEITGISISYNNKGNKSTYSVSSDQPINTIVITTDGNAISVRSSGKGNQATIQQGGNSSNINLEDHKKRSETMEMRRKEMKEKMNQRKAEMEMKRNEMMALRNGSKNQIDSNNTFVREITKNSSHADLEALKEEFEQKGMLFSYSDVKRNAKGEILHINLKLDDQKGSVSKSKHTSNDNPIKSIQIGIKDGTSILKSEQ